MSHARELCIAPSMNLIHQMLSAPSVAAVNSTDKTILHTEATVEWLRLFVSCECTTELEIKAHALYFKNTTTNYNTLTVHYINSALLHSQISTTKKVSLIG